MHRRRRQLVRDIEDTLQRQTYYQDFERYVELFGAPLGQPVEPMSLAGSVPEEVEVDDIDELDAYFDQLENKRELTGEQLFGVLNDGNWV